MNGIARLVPWLVVGLGAVYFAAAAWPPEDPRGGMHLTEFGRIPVVDRGRVKPLDTVARTSLMILTGGYQTFRHKETGAKGETRSEVYPAIRWMADVITDRSKDGGVTWDYEVFRIDNDQVLALLGLKPRTGLRYALKEFADQIGALDAQAGKARDKDPKQRDMFDIKVIELRQHLELYLELSQLQAPHYVPPSGDGTDWATVRTAVATRGQDDPSLLAIAHMLTAYRRGDVKEFNTEVDRYLSELERERPADVSRANFEAFFNNFAPFYHCTGMYVVVFLLSCVAWIGWTDTLRRSAFWLAALTLVVHTWALFARMYLLGRPLVFVTNLYSSAIFIGWGCVVLGLVLEMIYRNGMGNLVAAITGFLTLIVANLLGGGGDTLEMLQAVLDTNFWLATHVTTVTIGYTATFVAGFLAIIFVLMRVGFGLLHQQTASRDEQGTMKALAEMIYGIVCFATLFSFVGTVLGGIWADVSWGRFWGWDPKENGALLIVVWNAMILHARWGGMVKQHGMALLAIGGNIVTAWSWFGVNMLGVGLHSYGFMSGAVLGLTAFVLSMLLMIGVGLLPVAWKRAPASAAADGRAEKRRGVAEPVPAQ